MQIVYDADFPLDLKPKIESLLEKSKWLFPLWCQKLSLSWFSGETNKTAEIYVMKDYRHCQIYIYPIFVRHTEQQQFECIIHEIIHCFNVPMKTACLDAIDDALPDADEKINALAKRGVNKEMERVTQDFTFAILNKFK